MSSSNIGFEFSISNFPIELDFDMRVNVREDFNFLRYASSFGLRDIGVSYINSDPMNVNDNIIIKDLTASVPENSPRIFSETIYSSQNFQLPYAKFLITDVFKTRADTVEVPLYFRHDLTDHTSISEVQVLDGNFDPANADEYLYVDEEALLGTPRKSVYTNLSSTYDSAKDEYIVYYVRFKDDTSGEFVVELLDPKPFYSEVEFATLSIDRAYLSTSVLGQTDINIFFNSKAYSPTPVPGQHRFSVKIDADERVYVLRPSDFAPTEKWYLRVNPGEFYKNTVAGDARYYVPEYETQLFTPVPPFKLLVEKTMRVLTTRLLYVEPKTIADLEVSGFYLYIIIRDKFGNPVRALTNDPDASVYTTAAGVTTDIFFELDTIQSVSSQDGFVRLSTDIAIDGNVFMSYRYVENYYVYRGISLNSTLSPRVLNNRVAVYCIPEFITPKEKTIFHLLIDESDLIIDANEVEDYVTIEGESTGGTISTLIDTNLLATDIYTGFEIEILSGLNAGRRLQISGYNTGTKEITVAEDFESILLTGTRYRINKRFEGYSFQDPVTLTVFNYDGWIDVYTEDPFHYIMLSDVYAIQTLAPQNIDKTDVRIRGGGVNESSVDDSLSLQDETQWYWDIGNWDGQPYPGMGAILVEVPRGLLKEVGGDLSRQQIEEIVERHMAEGTYPIIKYYDKSTEIIEVTPGDMVIFVKWEDVEASSYNVYMGLNPDNLPLYRSVAGVITELEIDELDNNKVYYIMIESVVGGIPQLPSRIASAIPFNPTSILDPAVYGETDYGGGTYSSG